MCVGGGCEWSGDQTSEVVCVVSVCESVCDESNLGESQYTTHNEASTHTHGLDSEKSLETTQLTSAQDQAVSVVPGRVSECVCGWDHMGTHTH